MRRQAAPDPRVVATDDAYLTAISRGWLAQGDQLTLLLNTYRLHSGWIHDQLARRRAARLITVALLIVLFAALAVASPWGGGW